MSDKFFPDISVGDFAMDLLKSMAKDSNALKPALKESTIQSTGAPDVSKVEVSDDFVSLVTEGKKPKNKLVQKSITETTENKLTSLVERLSSLVSEAKFIIEEMSSGATTCGNIGVNMAEKSKTKTKKALSKYLLKYRND